MAGFAQRITKQVREDTSLFLIYPPGTPLRLGDVVERSGGAWTPVANLADDLDIEVKAEPDDKKVNWESTSRHGYSIETKLAGQSSGVFRYLSDAEAGVKITLSGDNAYVLSLKGVTITRISSIDAFWEQVREKRSFWTWELRRRIVTRLVTAASGTFLASAQGERSYELKAETDLKAGHITVADLAAGFTLKSTMAASDRFTSKVSITPLFGAHRVTLLGNPALASLEGDTPVADLKLVPESGDSLDEET